MKTKKNYNLIQALLLALALLIANPTAALATKAPKKVKKLKSNKTVAMEVIRGDWGNGEERKDKLTKAGYEYRTIQDIVNRYHGILYDVFIPVEGITVPVQNGTKQTTQTVRVSEKKAVVKKPAVKKQVVQNTAPQSSGIYSLGDLQFHGVINWNGYKFTYYSQRV